MKRSVISDARVGNMDVRIENLVDQVLSLTFF